ncbi:tyrosine phosphatase family protein [Terrarubrum flagellatum]|uniref:tyrosine phosphatase family protein n=1 Tax=Terrirubrum flagellatum TaxID=2895980 RepID=UPI003144FB62
MPSIHVCSLALLPETVRRTGASHIASLINSATPVERPADISPERHLFLGVSDITAALDGHVLAGESHVAELLAFIEGWGRKREKPIVIHCWAGVSRSTAAAFIGACMLAPETPEEMWARLIRELSPTATPNPHLVELADRLLGRRGRMVKAIAAIGRGAEAFTGVPFRLDLPPISRG